ASRTSISSFVRRNISRPALIRLRESFELSGIQHFTSTTRSWHFVRGALSSFSPPTREVYVWCVPAEQTSRCHLARCIRLWQSATRETRTSSAPKVQTIAAPEGKSHQ